MTGDEHLRWQCIIDAIPDVDRWNLNMPHLVKENGPEFREFAQTESKRRGYMWSKQGKCYVHPWEMKATKGKIVIGVGWRTGQLAIVLAEGNDHHRYESTSREVPIEIANKLVNSASPDTLYVQSVKGKIEMVRVI